MNDEIIEMEEPLPIYAGNLLRRGSEYFEAFRILARHNNPPKYPAYFLVFHAVELFLKSYLANNGFTKSDLKKQNIRHNIYSLYCLCEDRYFPDIKNLNNFITTINTMNDDHDFRYSKPYNLVLPNFILCTHFLNEIHLSISPKIINDDFM